MGLWMLGAGAFGQADLYISEYKFEGAQISAVRTDGANPRTLFALGPSIWLPIGLTFRPSTGRLFWMDSAGGSEIMTAGLNGSGLGVVGATAGFGKGASIDAQGRVYFSADNTIRRMNANGTGLVTLYTSAVHWPVHPPRVDVTNGHLYFGDDGKILRTDLDGGNVKVVINGVSQARSVAVDLAARKIYWTDADTISDHIARANLDGSGFEIIEDPSPSVVQSSGLIDMLVHPATGTLYYADELVGDVRKKGVDGGPTTTLWTSVNGRSPSGLVLSSGEPVQPLNDCDGNGVGDDADIAAGAADCDNNGVPDRCQSNPCPARVYLLDHGSNAALSTAKTVGTQSHWEVWQPFDVPAGGWTIGEIALDGFTVNYHDGSGAEVRLCRDNAAVNEPDDSEILAATTINFRFNINYENWVYRPMRADLPQGRYWVGVVANAAPTYYGAANLGFTGLGSRSRGASGVFSDPGSSIALRLVRGVTCPADFNRDGFVDGFDYDDFVRCFEGEGCPDGASADFDNDGFVDGFDYDQFVAAFETPC